MDEEVEICLFLFERWWYLIINLGIESKYVGSIKAKGV